MTIPVGQANTSLLAKDIKILKENKIYRFADLVLQRGIRWKEDRASILTDKCYSNTILYEYLSSLKDPFEREKPNLRLLHECIVQYSLSNNLIRPENNFLTLPLRLGDICDIPERYQASLKYCLNIYNMISASRMSKPNGFYIVTAMHFGANEKNNRYFFTENAMNKSLSLFYCVVDQLRSFQCPIKVISHENVDIDICFIARSEFVAPSQSKMTELIREAQMSTMKNVTRDELFIRANSKQNKILRAFRKLFK